MQPNNDSTNRSSMPRIPERSLPPVTPTYQQPNQPTNGNPAAANIVRGKIDAIYGDKTVASSHTDDTPAQTIAPHNQQPLTIENPYERTHMGTIHPQPDQWQQYHSAWQNYYQRYYERYYVNQVHETAKQLEARVAQAQPRSESATNENTPPVQSNSSNKQGVTREEALYDLRSRLRNAVQSRTKNIHKSRHFIPITAAVLVVFIFGFLQYNRVLIANVKAYVSPGSIDPQNIIVDPSTAVAVSPDPKLIIPKINVDVPVVYNVGFDYASQMKAMESGIAHFSIPGANSVPGQVGNTVLSGHSSNDLLDQGDYKFIFAQLEKLSTGDMIYANYEGVRYSYTVTKMEVVLPTQVDKLIYETDKPVLTLITCTPLGTAEKRLLVTAEQISPDPTKAIPATTDNSGEQSVAIPGNSPTLIERLFNN